MTHDCKICGKSFPIGCTCALVEKKRKPKKKEDDRGVQMRLARVGSPRQQLLFWKNSREAGDRRDGNAPPLPQSSPPTD